MRLSLCINRPWRPSVHGRDNQHGRSYSNSRSERHRPCHASGFRLAVLQEEKKNDGEEESCTAECRAAIVDVVNYHVKGKHRHGKAAGLFPWLIFSAVQAAPLGKWLPGGENGDAGTLLLSRVPVYLPGERPMNRSAMSRQWRNRPGKRWERSLHFYRSGQTYQLLLPGGGKGLLSAAPCLPDRRSSRHCGFDYDWSHVANNIASAPAAAKPAAGGFLKRLVRAERRGTHEFCRGYCVDSDCMRDNISALRDIFRACPLLQEKDAERSGCTVF